MAEENANAGEPPEGGPASYPAVEIALKRPPFWSSGFTLLFLVLLASAVGYYASLVQEVRAGSELPLATLLLRVVVPSLVCLAAVGVRLLVRPRAVPPIVFYDSHMSAPRSAESPRAATINYDEVVSVDLRGRGPGERLFIGTKRRLLSFPRPAFAAPDAVEGTLKELYARILRLPQGAKIVEQIARRRKVALVAMSSSPAGTHALLATVSIMFGLEYIGGGFASPLGPVRFGASAPALVRDGEVFRLLSSTVLHANLLHLYFSVLGLFFVGSILERLIGRARFLLVYFIAALAGAVASVLLGGGLYAVNGSVGTLGLLGGFAVVNHRFKGELPVGFRQPLRWWLVVVVLNVMLPLAVAEIDLTALLVGLVTGAFVALLVLDAGEALDPTAAPRPGLRLLAGLLSAMFGVAVFTALGVALRRDSDVEGRLARLVTEAPDSSAPVLNELAWKLVTAEASSADELSTALTAAERAREAEPDDVAILDTVAAAQFRNGKIDEAIATQSLVLARTADTYYAEHLALFLETRLDSDGPELVGGADEVTLGVRADVAAGALRVQLGGGAAASQGAVALVLVRRGEEVVGLVRLMLGAGNQQGELRVTPDMHGGSLADADYEVARVELGCPACPPASSQAQMWSLEQRIGDLDR